MTRVVRGAQPPDPRGLPSDEEIAVAVANAQITDTIRRIDEALRRRNPTADDLRDVLLEIRHQLAPKPATRR